MYNIKEGRLRAGDLLNVQEQIQNYVPGINSYSVFAAVTESRIQLYLALAKIPSL